MTTDAGPSAADVVVAVPFSGRRESFVRCLASLLRHTGADTPIIVADDASPDPAAREWVAETAEVRADQRIFWLRRETPMGPIATLNEVIARVAPADIAVVHDDCVVASGWLEGLREAAYSDTLIATAMSVTNGRSLTSVPDDGMSRPRTARDVPFEEAAARLRAGAARSRPRLPFVLGRCVWIKRAAIDLAGPFDPALSSDGTQIVDFSQRCVQLGLQHVLADDVLVEHWVDPAGWDVDADDSRGGAPVDAVISARYPYWQ